MRNGTVRRRLARLEARVGINVPLPPNLFLFFTDGRSEPVRAKYEGHEWHRGSNEPKEDFEHRIVADLEAKHYRKPYLIFLFS
jgi:hypothetical protein